MKRALYLFDEQYHEVQAMNKNMYRYDAKRQVVIYKGDQVIPDITSEKLHKLRVSNFFARKGLEYQTASEYAIQLDKLTAIKQERLKIEKSLRHLRQPFRW